MKTQRGRGINRGGGLTLMQGGRGVKKRGRGLNCFPRKFQKNTKKGEKKVTQNLGVLDWGGFGDTGGSGQVRGGDIKG